MKTLKADQRIKKSKALTVRIAKAVESVDTLKAEFAALQQAAQEAKAQRSEVKVVMQKFVARQKAVQRFEKAWAKAQKEKIIAKRIKRKVRAKSKAENITADALADELSDDLEELIEPIMA